jgi:hypothetical protein
MDPDIAPESVPIFVDATGRRASVARRITQVLGVLVLLYVALLAGSLVHAPGVARVSLPGVGRLFPAAEPREPPSIDTAPNVTVIAAAVGRGTPTARPATTSAAATTTSTGGGSTSSTGSAPSKTKTSSGPGNGAGNGNGGTTNTSTNGTTNSTTNGRGPSSSGPPGQQREHTNSNGSASQENGHGGAGGKTR